jgi:hypothetical protein
MINLIDIEDFVGIEGSGGMADFVDTEDTVGHPGWVDTGFVVGTVDHASLPPAGVAH